MGINFHTPNPPTDVYCPNAVSSRNSGIPAKTRVVKYGMRKAPKTNVIQRFLDLHLLCSLEMQNTCIKVEAIFDTLSSNSQSAHIKHVNSLIRATLIGVSKVRKKRAMLWYTGGRQWVLF